MKCEACSHANVDGARFCANCGALMPVEAKDGDPMIGQLVGGRFRITGVLGEGGMGVVYVGEQSLGSTLRKVAVKTLHPHLSKDDSVRKRFDRECGIVAQLEHPNTIKVYDFGSTQDGTLYIAMEFVSGRALADVIRSEGSLAADRVVRIMRQVCGALDEAHAQGIVHRDLKPENVILTNRAGDTDFVKVLDFGIAARRESADAQKEQKLTQQGMVLGTPPYMSPEQFTGKDLDARSDVYSLGVMVFEMLTGRLPFEADTPWQWATQHMTAVPLALEVAAPSKHFEPAIRHTIAKALAKDREQRQASSREFFSELSEGGRVTVEAAPPAAATAVASGTAAMDVVPDFGGPRATVASSPQMGTPAGIVTPVRAPGAPPARPAKGGGKGLVIGLGAVGSILLVAIGVIALRNPKEPDDQPPPSAAATNEGTPPSAFGNNSVTNIAPVDTPPAATTAAPVPGTAGAAGAAANVTPTSPKTSTATATSTTPKPPAGGACDACAGMAASGNIQGAAAALQSCTDDAKKKACSSAIRRQAPQAAQAAAMNGKCPQALLIIAAAEKAGVPSGPLRASIRNTSCK